MHTTPPTESIIDLTLDPPSPPVADNSGRWSNFRSGYVDIYLSPSSNSSRTSPLEPDTDPRPSAQQSLAQVVGRRGNMYFVHSNDSRPHLTQPNTCTNDTVPLRLAEDRRIDGSLSDALEGTCPSHSSDYSATPEDAADMFPSSPDCSPLVRGFTVTCGRLSLPRGSHDKPRHVLRDDDSAYVVTAHGVIDQVRTAGVLKLDRNIRSPPLASEEFVDDACILSHHGEPVIILGHAREQHQITVLNLRHSQVNISQSSSSLHSLTIAF